MKNLITLDLSTFNTSSVTQLHYMFYGCEKLEYVNFRKALLSSNLNNYGNMIGATSKNIVFCITESMTSILNSLIAKNCCSTIISDCSSNWRKFQKKIVQNSNTCVDNCTSTSFPYEYLGKCYTQCPKGTYENNNFCYDCDSDCNE